MFSWTFYIAEVHVKLIQSIVEFFPSIEDGWFNGRFTIKKVNDFLNVLRPEHFQITYNGCFQCICLW